MTIQAHSIHVVFFKRRRRINHSSLITLLFAIVIYVASTSSSTIITTSSTSPANGMWVMAAEQSIQSTTTTTTTMNNKINNNKNNKALTIESMFPGLRNMEYAVRGKVVIEADKIHAQLQQQQQQEEDKESSSSSSSSSSLYPFDHIVYTNIGNPHSVGGKPLTWPRQVMALVDLPNEVGIDHPNIRSLFPSDVIERAREIKDQLRGHGTGAYTHSQGVLAFRQHVANFIQQRDGGIPSSADNIFLTNGASQGIAMMLNAIVAHSKVGIMIPIPQYPLYSATIDLLQGQRVGYKLHEDNGWSLQMKELERSYQEATKQGIDVRAMVIINPGNPSGSVLTRKNVHDVVKFCAKHKLVLLADEVYQENVYDDKMEFISCKQAAHELGLLRGSRGHDDDDEDDAIELVSFHSTSKGVFGECGRRGGYMELVGIDEQVKESIYKLASAFLCSSTNGQIMTSLMVNGPKFGDASYENHEAEKQAIFNSLKRRSLLVSRGLNAIPGFSCQPAKGAMYCFPRMQLPQNAIRAANDQGMAPDTLYAVSLLQKTGICVVPASGFGQEEGRFGFRTTFLPGEDEMATVVEKIRQHYNDFCHEYK